MKIYRNLLYFTLLLMLFIFNVLSLNKSNNLFIIPLISSIFISIFPGFLSLIALQVKYKGFWQYLVLSIGISISILMFGGLLLNWVLPIFSTIKPLTFIPLLLLTNVICISLMIIGYFRYETQTVNLRGYSIKPVISIYLVPIVLLLLSVFGAIRLNNGGNNIFTIISLSGYAVFLTAISIVRNKIPKSVYPYTVFIFSLSLLFMLSLRSNYIVGWDIHDEYQIFLRTLSAGKWEMDNFRNPYNACLSINILPVFYTLMTGLSGTIIYKVVYQVLFAFVPVVIYMFLTKYVRFYVAFLSVLYFVIQPFFIQPMTGLMRQEIAFLFFSLMMYVLFSRDLPKAYSKLLFIIFGISMVVSHYSTTYFTLVLSLIVYVLARIIGAVRRMSVIYKIPKLRLLALPKSNYYFTLPLILILYGFAFLWYIQITDTAGGLRYIFQNVINNSQNIFKSELKSQEAARSLAIIEVQNVNTIENLNKYSDYKQEQYRNYKNPRYLKEEYAQYPIYPIYSRTAPALIQSQIRNYILYGFILLKQASKTFLILGLIYIFYLKIIRKKFDLEYILMILVCSFIITLMLIHPTLSLFYNVSRLYLQILVISSVSAIFGNILILPFLRQNIRLSVTSVILVILFIFYSGFSTAIIGGETLMQLYNFGYEYNTYYIHKSEITAIHWLGVNRNYSTPVYADNVSNLRLKSVLNINASTDVFPSLIFVNSYVFSRYANIVDNSANISFDGKALVYNHPIQFLNDRKNLVYSTGVTAIHK